MSIFTRPILEIDLNKLLENYIHLKELANDAIAAAVLKDDAYGLGACEIAGQLYEKADCRNFFVAHAIEGEKIYPYVKGSNIYVLQGAGKDSIDLFNKYKFIPVINSLEQYSFWKQNKTFEIKPVLHVDTGLNRLGFREEHLEKLSKTELNDFSLIISHLACADVNEHFMNKKQINKFNSIKTKYFPNTPASLSASDGIFLGSDFHFDMVRLGAAVYGINTAPYRQTEIKNVIEIKAPIIQISNLSKDDLVGYGVTYKANTERKIAVVSIGYGDGYPRNLSNIGKIFFKINNHIEYANVIGRVSMDNIICDITHIESISPEDYAYIIFDQYTVDDMGNDSQTIGYEILSRFGKNKRFDRKYIK